MTQRAMSFLFSMITDNNGPHGGTHTAMSTQQTDRRIIGYGTVGTGALLVLVGIGLVIVQFWIVAHAPMPEFPSRGASVSETGASINTTYIGAIVIAIGAVLMILGARLFGPVIDDKNSN